MRITSGEFRGRVLTAPKGLDTRPMLGRVREAMFSTFGGHLDGVRVLDLFSGTGSLGLEALSRGAEFARFVERDRRALTALRHNVELLGVEARCEVLGVDALSPAAWSAPVLAEDEAGDDAGDDAGDGADDAGSETGPWAHLILMDPPYPMLREPDVRRRLLAATGRLGREVLAPGGVLMIHGHPRDLREDALAIEGTRLERRVYGNTALLYFWRD